MLGQYPWKALIYNAGPENRTKVTTTIELVRGAASRYLFLEVFQHLLSYLLI